MPAGEPPPTSADSKPRPLYEVFVSSTYRDNEERRKLVQDAITTAGMLWHGMELFTATTKPTVEACLRHAGEADVLVGIIAWRYGWEPDGSEISITEMEYAAAKERLMFLIDPSLPVKPEIDFDPLPDRWKKQDKLEAFKQRIQKDQIPALFRAETLQANVLNSLNKWREAREKPEPEEPVAVSPDAEALKEAEAAFRRRVRERFAKDAAYYIPLRGETTEKTDPPKDPRAPRSACRRRQRMTAEYCEWIQQDRDIVRVKLDSLREAADKYPCVILLGEPGCGKTTALEHLAYELADETGPLPLALRLSEFAPGMTLENFVVTGWSGPEDAKHWAAPELAANLTGYLQQGRLFASSTL